MTNAHIYWQKFDADNPDPEAEKIIKMLQCYLLIAAKIDGSNLRAVREYATAQIDLYTQGDASILNKTLMIHTFRPSEFDSIKGNDTSLSELQQFLSKEQFSWHKGSKTVQRALYDKFEKAGSVRMAGGREYVDLDNLITVGGKTVAIEVETSINLDNGYFTLRQAIRNKRADYGVMIVPWTAEGSGRADEGKALGRLDREFDGATDLRDGPIYRIAIVRQIDLYRLLAAM